MGDPLTVKDWCINGLPTDYTSCSSALILELTKKWPNLIDPQKQAIKWLNKQSLNNDKYISINIEMKESIIMDRLRQAF